MRRLTAPKPGTPEWEAWERRTQALLDEMDEEKRAAFMANRAEVCQRLGAPEEECPLAAGFIGIPTEADLERGRQLAEEHGW